MRPSQHIGCVCAENGILEFVEPLLQFAGNFWWLLFPLGGVIGGGVRAVAAANERRAERRLERYRIKQQTKVEMARAAGAATSADAAHQRAMAKLLEQHDRTNARWLDYEIDLAKGDEKAIKFIVAGKSYDTKSEAMTAYAETLDKYLNDQVLAVRYTVGVGLNPCGDQDERRSPHVCRLWRYGATAGGLAIGCGCGRTARYRRSRPR